MAAYTGTFNFYNSFKEYMADGTIDLDTHVFKVLLTTSSYTPSATTHTILTDVTNELSATGGYAQQTLASVTWTEPVVGTMMWDAADTQFAATGADYDAARYWVLFDETATQAVDALVAYGEIDGTPGDVTVTDGTTLTLQWHSNGLFRLT